MKNHIKTVIMAGGKGSRIQSIASDVPKPLVLVNGKPILQWEIECLISQGFSDIILTISHKGERIVDYFGDGSKLGCNISYFQEDIPLGNAGALFKMLRTNELEDNIDILLLNADSLFSVDFHRFLQFHWAHQGVLATLFTHPNSHPYDSGLILTDTEGYVEQWLTKEDERPSWYKNQVNAGLHVLNTSIFTSTDIDISSIGERDADDRIVKVDLDRDVLKPLAGTGKLLAYRSPEYVKDMGTPERFASVCADLSTGRVSCRNLKRKQHAIFLDRDGTINRYKGFLRSPDEFELLPNVADAIRLINDSGFLCIVVTNQPVIARGEMTIEELTEIHDKMETLLGEQGAYVDAIYYCPHHPDKGFEGEIEPLKINCDCRKPKPGMLYKAAEDYNIDLNASWMIGDSWRDVACGKNAGTHTVYIQGDGSEQGGGSIKHMDNDQYLEADYVASGLLEAVKILSQIATICVES